MQIIKVLSLLRTARVLAYNIVKHYKGQQANPESLGGALPVQAILVGEMDRRDAELFLQLELIDMSDGSHRWGGQFRKTWSDVCSRPEELASEVCDQLRPILAPKRHAA
jgi:TolB-like protein